MAAEAEFEAWARATAPGLYARPCLLRRDPHLAEDLVQDTLTKVFVAWRRVDRDSNPDGYAMRTLYHQFVSRRRRRSSSELVSDSLPELMLPESDPPNRMDLAEALSELKPAERALVIIRFVDDLSVAHTA